MSDVERYLVHSSMSAPGGFADAIAGLPSEVKDLNETLQGVIVHSDWAREYGVDQTQSGSSSRRTLSVVQRLNDIMGREPKPLHERRPAARRSIGTCRDFALMLCSFLRSKGVPARVRCGFAAYFRDGWEDHWVCEYWNTKTGKWHLSDAQLDMLQRQRNAIQFDPADLPRDFFVSAGEAWLECRRGEQIAASFGHGDVTGLWFIKVNVWRDHYALNGRETSNWDRWREASPGSCRIPDNEWTLLDELAARPEQRLIERAPDWLSH